MRLLLNISIQCRKRALFSLWSMRLNNTDSELLSPCFLPFGRKRARDTDVVGWGVVVWVWTCGFSCVSRWIYSSFSVTCTSKFPFWLKQVWTRISYSTQKRFSSIYKVCLNWGKWPHFSFREKLVRQLPKFWRHRALNTSRCVSSPFPSLWKLRAYQCVIPSLKLGCFLPNCFSLLTVNCLYKLPHINRDRTSLPPFFQVRIYTWCCIFIRNDTCPLKNRVTRIGIYPKYVENVFVL